MRCGVCGHDEGTGGCTNPSCPTRNFRFGPTGTGAPQPPCPSCEILRGVTEVHQARAELAEQDVHIRVGFAGRKEGAG